MSRTGPHDHAGKASAEQGQVLLDGPAGVAIALTPDAAQATGEGLIRAASQAREQRVGDTGPQ